MFRLSRKLSYTGLLGVASLIVASKLTLCNDEASCKSLAPKNSHTIVLTNDSIDSINKKLDSLGYNGYNACKIAVLSRNSSDDVTYQLEPLLCDRVAFRLQGVVKPIDENVLAIYGNVSQFVGDLKDESYQPTIIASKNPINDVLLISRYLDIPTRINSLSSISDEVCVDINKGVVQGLQHDPIRVIVQPLTWVQQIVVEGHLCNSQYLSDDGKCLFDRSLIRPSPPSKVMETTVKPLKSLANTHHPEDEHISCPLCRFFRKGSCRSEFIAWDECMVKVGKEGDVTQCSPPTLELFRCMSKDPYYDIMSVNSHNIIPNLEKAVESRKSENINK